MFIRIILIAIILSFLFYIVNTKILGKKISISKSATIILLTTIGVYITLGLVSHLLNQ
jgi:E3 ubiquitin-protein ligase DOA10